MRLRFWRKKTVPKPLGMVRVGRVREREPMTDADWKARRWDAASTNRLNAAHWAKALGQNINQDLASYLSTLRMRATHELSNNSFAAGVVETHVTDIVGPNGPILQVQSDSPTYNDEFEGIWGDWWKRPDVNGILSGVDFLDLWVRSLWPKGEFLSQIVTDKGAVGPVQARLLALAAEQLATPPAEAGTDDVILGIKRTETGRPLVYWIDQSSRATLGTAEQYRPIPAEFIIHGFKMQETGQVRGVPWLACALQAMADLRDYDDQVLDAARAAADWAVYLSAESADVAPIEVGTSADIERRTLTTLPAGYKASSHQAQQPSTEYESYRKERLREIGRPVNMPLMTVRLDSGDHNMASARFDAAVYNKGISKIQRWLASVALDRLVLLVLSESRLSKIAAPPKSVRYSWIWSGAPDVDPKKEADAEETRMLKTKTLTMADALAKRGIDLDEHMNQLEKEQKDREKRGITLAAAVASVPNPNKDDEDEDEDDKKSPAARGNGRLTAAIRMRM